MKRRAGALVVKPTRDRGQDKQEEPLGGPQ